MGAPSAAAPSQWRPRASAQVLERRARLLRELREFFAEREVLEVETPLLGVHGTSDLHLENITCAPEIGHTRALPTSPESAMKRLLAAGSGPIYQICKAFRANELGRRHQPEFTILEWYRPHYDLRQLEEEIDALLRHVGSDLGLEPTMRSGYAELWQAHLGLDPHHADTQELRSAATDAEVASPEALARCDRDDLLGLLMAAVVEPQLPKNRPIFVYDFPASQAAMAAVERRGSAQVARRCELYVDGMELANAYLELLDAAELRQRMHHDRQQRRERGKADSSLDAELLAAMEQGLPPCCGVALGVDRLLMLLCGAKTIDDVLAFPYRR